jgi:hypothetical protein
VSVTINAHQLGRLIDKTAAHMDGEDNEVLYGIRFDADARYLHAVASDRFTLAVARYGLNHGDCDQEPWAALLPAEHVETVREWLRAMKGAAWITLSLAKDRLVFEGPRTDLNIGIEVGIEYPDWRGVLRKLTETSSDGEPFPCLDSGYLSRFDTGDILRARVTADLKPVLLFGEDFIGAVMPARYAGLGPAEQESFETAFTAWHWTLAAGAKDADMAHLPKPEPRDYEATKNVEGAAEALLQQVMHSTSDMRGKSSTNPDEFMAHVLPGVHSWMAYRFLDALHTADPRLAAEVVAGTADELDSGELGEFAWDAAEKAGHNPQKWHDDYEGYLKKRAEERAAEAETAKTTA